MSPGLDVVDEWPELFEGLDPIDVRHIRSTFGSAAHEDLVPSRAMVRDVVAYHKGEINAAEYDRRLAARIGL